MHQDDKLVPFVVFSDKENSSPEESKESTCKFLNKEIHHIIRIDFFLNMLRENKLVFKRVFAWDDPYEAAMFKQKINVSGKIMNFSENTQNIYGQCWSQKPDECDGLWRVYSDNRRNDVVRLTTTVRLLLQAVLSSPVHNKNARDFAIGNVLYQKRKEIETRNLNFGINDFGNAPLCGKNLLLFKREEFAYEKEVRLIYKGGFPDKRECDLMPIPLGVDIKKVFTHITLSPWMCRCKKDAFKEELKRIAPSEMLKVAESDLYEPMSGVVFCESLSPEKAEKMFGEEGVPPYPSIQGDYKQIDFKNKISKYFSSEALDLYCREEVCATNDSLTDLLKEKISKIAKYFLSIEHSDKDSEAYLREEFVNLFPSAWNGNESEMLLDVVRLASSISTRVKKSNTATNREIERLLQNVFSVCCSYESLHEKKNEQTVGR